MRTGTKHWMSGCRLILHTHTEVCPATMDPATGCSKLCCEFTYALRYSGLPYLCVSFEIPQLAFNHQIICISHKVMRTSTVKLFHIYGYWMLFVNL